jgi:hypothetical protein
MVIFYLLIVICTCLIFAHEKTGFFFFFFFFYKVGPGGFPLPGNTKIGYVYPIKKIRNSTLGGCSSSPPLLGINKSGTSPDPPWVLKGSLYGTFAAPYRTPLAAIKDQRRHWAPLGATSQKNPTKVIYTYVILSS